MGAYRVASLAVLVVAAAVVGAAPGDSPIELPKPAVVPAPMPAPGTLLVLGGDQLYVINSKVDASVRAHPRGLVKVEKKKGPRDISAKFVDGLGQVEDREYAGPFVFVVKAVGKGQVELDVIPYGHKSDDEIVSTVFNVDASIGGCPDPPPVPPKPDPNPQPKPVPMADLAWVIVVEETTARTPAIAKVLNDTAFWTGLSARNVTYRFYDKDSPDLAGKNYDGYVDPTTGKRVLYAKTIGLPYVLYLDKKGVRLKIEELPASTSDIDASIKGK